MKEGALQRLYRQPHPCDRILSLVPELTAKRGNTRDCVLSYEKDVSMGLQLEGNVQY